MKRFYSADVADDLLAEVKRAATYQNLTVSFHVEENAENKARTIKIGEMCSALKSATSAVLQPDGCIRAEGGRTRRGEPLTVVCRLRQHDVLIITAFEG